jgi:hypothetical protein
MEEEKEEEKEEVEEKNEEIDGDMEDRTGRWNWMFYTRWFNTQ